MSMMKTLSKPTYGTLKNWGFADAVNSIDAIGDINRIPQVHNGDALILAKHNDQYMARYGWGPQVWGKSWMDAQIKLFNYTFCGGLE